MILHVTKCGLGITSLVVTLISSQCINVTLHNCTTKLIYYQYQVTREQDYRCYISGLSQNVTTDDLSNRFSSFG